MNSWTRGVQSVTKHNRRDMIHQKMNNDGINDVDEETLASNDDDDVDRHHRRQHEDKNNNKTADASGDGNLKRFSFYDRRERSQKVALLALGMFVLVMFVGLMPLASKKRSRNSGYVGDAFRSNEDTIICTSSDGNGNGNDGGGGDTAAAFSAG